MSHSHESHGNSCGHCHHHDEDVPISKTLKMPLFALAMLLLAIVGEHFFPVVREYTWFVLLWYMVPFYLTALPVIKEAYHLLLQKDFFNEITLMSFACIGAMALGQYAEGVGVMIFYTIGEVVQHHAVEQSRKNIKSLLSLQIREARKIIDNKSELIAPEEVHIGDVIEVYVGEHVPLDGILINEQSYFNTAALTGESLAREISHNEDVLAGMIPSQSTVQITVTKEYKDSALVRILNMVEDATERKSPVEQFIRRFARIYTPAVFALATLLVVVPIFVVSDYRFSTWFFRALVFLVISCPCAFVLSVPLSYFGGIGLSSRHGLLFKGGNFLDALTRLKFLVVDKTGTMTKGIFSVQKLESSNENLCLKILFLLETKSKHPIAKAILSYLNEKNISYPELQKVEEISGKGMKAEVDNHVILAGNKALMNAYDISVPTETRHSYTVVYVAQDQEYIGAIYLADAPKEDAQHTIQQLKKQGVQTIMLSGDRDEIVQEVAMNLSVDKAYGDLLPQDKVRVVEELQIQYPKEILAFMGDGINDAPVLAMSDIGIAMGAYGSDLAIETADLVIQTDEPSRILTALQIAKKTKSIVIFNIALAFIVKLIVLVLGAQGLASMWEAIFADVGVSLIATFNAVRLLSSKIS